MKKVRITLRKSLIGSTKTQKRTSKALGLGKVSSQVEKEVTPQIEGMINKLSHLIIVEEI
jgi:large subunit ribosomal protein L30